MILAALVVYVHYILAPALLAHVVYVWIRRHDLPLRSIVVVGAALGLLLLPLIPIVLATLDERDALSLGMQSVGAVLLVILPPEVLAAMAAGIAVVAGRIRLDTDVAARDPAGLPMVWVWAAAPPIVLFAVSWIIGAGVLGPQHITISAPRHRLARCLGDPASGPIAGSPDRRRVHGHRVAHPRRLPPAVHGRLAGGRRLRERTRHGYVHPGSRQVRARAGESHRLVDGPTPNPCPARSRGGISGERNSRSTSLRSQRRRARYLEEEVLPIVGSEPRFAVVSWSIGDRVLPYLQGRLRSIGFELQQRRTFGPSSSPSSNAPDGSTLQSTRCPDDSQTRVRDRTSAAPLGPRGRHGDNTRSGDTRVR